jgi:hypothetical protein
LLPRTAPGTGEPSTAAATRPHRVSDSAGRGSLRKRRRVANATVFHDRPKKIHAPFTDRKYHLARDSQQPIPLTSYMKGADMSKEKEIVRIDLTNVQKQVLKKETGKDVDAIELTINELEERIAPVKLL